MALVLALGAVLPQRASAQRAVTVRADNDAFNFWQLPWTRPDEEYTSGVRLTLEYAGPALWARHLGHALGGCPGEAATCMAHSYSLGQDIFTAVRPEGHADASPGGRPDAGVLWLSSSMRLERPGDLTELGWTVGTTGRPSLAEPTQQFFHDLAPWWNRPIAWSRQLPAEPVLAVTLDRRGLGRLGTIEVQPHAGASLGNLLTEVRAGMSARLGRGMSHPWQAARPRTEIEYALIADATLRGVARNEVLSGTMFRPSERVDLRPLVTEMEGGVRLRWRSIAVAWLAHRTSAEYSTRTAAHVWSTLEAAWRPGR